MEIVSVRDGPRKIPHRFLGWNHINEEENDEKILKERKGKGKKNQEEEEEEEEEEEDEDEEEEKSRIVC